MKSPLATLTKGKESIKAAFGKGSSTPVDEAGILEERRQGFRSAHGLAEKRVEQLRKTPGADRNAKVKDLVKATGDLSAQVKQAGEDAKDVKGVEDACKSLSKIYEKANEATTACTGPNMDAFEKARDKARSRIGDMRQLPGAATYLPLQSRITAADDVYTKATALAREAVNAAEVKTQIDALGLIAKLKLEAKQNSNKYLESAPKNLADFEKKRKGASDRLAEVRSLRGANNDPETANRLQNADKILEDITTKARAAKKESEVTDQIKRLEAIETLAKSVESLSKDAKQRAKSDVKALPKYNAMIIEAEKARDALMDIGVANGEYIALTNLIAAAKLTLVGKGPGQALSDLSEYTNLVATADKKQQDLKNKVPPVEVLTEVAKLSPLLKQLEKLAPEYLDKMHSDETDRLVLLGQTDSAKAVTGLQALLETVKGDLDVVQKQKADAEKKAAAFETAKDDLVKAGYKAAFFNVAAQLGKLAAELDFPARDWGRAVERLDKAIALVGEVETAQQNAKAEWEKGDADRKRMRQLAVNLLSWMPLASQANNLLGSIDELDQQFKATGDYAACQAEYLSMNLDVKETSLREAMQNTPDMPDLGSLKELRKKYTEADKEVHPIFADAETKFLLLERLMKGTADPRGSQLYQDLLDAQDEWQAIMDNPKGDADPSALVKPFVTRAKKILADADTLLKDPKKLDEFGKDAKVFESRNPNGKLPARITEMISQLERSGIAMPNQRQTLRGLLDPATTAEARGDGLLKLQEEIEGLVAANKRLEADRVAMTKEVVNTHVKQPLKKIKGNREFQPYQKSLEAQADDLEAMTDSDDPYFLKVARAETVTLTKKVVALDPERGDQGARYKAVEERWNRLSKGLGGDMKELLPNTHAALRTELATLVGKSRKLPPKQALAVFDDIEPRIQAAAGLLPKIKAEKDKYKVRKERLEKQWAQVKKETKTRVTDRVTDFADSFEVRLGEADGALKEENGFRRANTILKGLEDKLRTVETSSDPRAALQKMDAAVAQDQRAIRDLARAFEEELKYFKETTIPRARTLIKARAAEQKSLAEKVGDKLKGAVSKLTETKVGGTDLDQELLESLESTLTTAPRPVQSYLDMISTTTIGAAKSPELSTASSAFKSARGMIASATRTVDALKTNATGGADMSVTQDLKKVQANWIAQTQNYSKTVRAMADAIRDAAKDDPDEEVKAAAAKAAKTVADAASVFHATAFEGEFKEMEKKDATKEAKLAAREKALTTMRAYRKLLLNHPLHKQLADPANPFTQGSAVRAAARGILVGLKRIELETLVN